MVDQIQPIPQLLITLTKVGAQLDEKVGNCLKKTIKRTQ